jgi:hypothetical protein
MNFLVGFITRVSEGDPLSTGMLDVFSQENPSMCSASIWMSKFIYLKFSPLFTASDEKLRVGGGSIPCMWYCIVSYASTSISPIDLTMSLEWHYCINGQFFNII